MRLVFNLGVILLSWCSLTAAEYPMKLNLAVLVPCSNGCLASQLCATCTYKGFGPGGTDADKQWCSDVDHDKGLCDFSTDKISCHCPTVPVTNPVYDLPDGACVNDGDCPPNRPKCATCRFNRVNRVQNYCFNPNEEDLCDSDHRFKCSCGQLLRDYSKPDQAILGVPAMVGSADSMDNQIGNIVKPVHAVDFPLNYGSNNLLVPVDQPVANNVLDPQFQPDQDNLGATWDQIQDPYFVGNTAPLGA